MSKTCMPEIRGGRAETAFNANTTIQFVLAEILLGIIRLRCEHWSAELLIDFVKFWG